MDYPGKVITKTQVTPTQTSASGNWTLDDQAAAIKNNNWPVALVPNPISKSLRFNSADSANLNRTPASAGNRKTMTYSFWVKRGFMSSTQQNIISAGAVSDNYLAWSATNDNIEMNFRNGGSGSNVFLITTPVYRDPSAWYHVVLAIDTTQATASDRVKLYVNGVQITAFSTTTYPTQNNDLNSFGNNVIQYIGQSGVGGSNFYLDGYLTEVYYVNGQALTPSSFGMTNPQTGQWIPLKYSGTYGTNGFYLNFKDATSTTTLGYDYSGNANNWTTNNFSVTAGAGNDSLTDVPTPWFAYNTTGDVGGVIRGNYATLNPVWKNLYPGVYANGNLDFSTSTAKYGNAFSTIGLTSGKWYVEVLVSGTIGSALKLGVSNQTTLNYLVGTEDDITPTTGVGYAYFLTNGNKSTNATNSAYGNSVASGDIVGIILDLDNGKIWFSKNGTVQASGDPVAGTNAAFTGITASSVWFFGGTTYATQASFVFNFGQRPFAYTPPTGFRSLCTTNLPATAIGFGLTNQGGNYFNTVLYTGNSTARSITGVGFQPDFTWIKMRSGVSNHALFDSVRGATQWLASNLNQAETTDSVSLTSFDSDGFSLGTGANLVAVNNNTSTFVAWNWNAGGSNVTNTNGTRTSTVRANTTAGFSIVTWTANGSSPQTIGHGLGVAPSMIITFLRNLGGDNHFTYHASLGATKNVRLDETAAAATQTGAWNDTAPTSTVFSTGNFAAFTTNGCSLVAYCFAAVPGYSAFGSYTGNGSTDGPFVYTGFRPKFILGKRSDAANGWFMFDGVRNDFNVADDYLAANASAAEATFVYGDFLSNGFKLRATTGDWNGSGGTIIYAAFAEFPFQFANAR